MIGAHVNVNINLDAIISNARRTVLKIIKRDAYPIANKFFKRAYNKMLRDYDKSPIVLEIEAGPGAIDSSGATDGYGNLFSFLGFYYGDQPTKRLRELLELSTLSTRMIIKDDVATFAVKVPSKNEIDLVTQLPWPSPQNWVEIVENGLDSLTQYLYTKKRSYPTSISTKGFQLGHELNDDLEFKTNPFLTEILSNFKNSINNKELDYL